MASEHSILVYPCEQLTVDDDTQRAARNALFGPLTQLSPGGWWFYDKDVVLNAQINPPVAASEAVAEQMGLAFMQATQDRWLSEGRTSYLFPLDSGHHRLELADTSLLSSGSRYLAWRLTWRVALSHGASAAVPEGSDGFAPAPGAEITLIIALTGRVVGGSATWRPLFDSRLEPQKTTPEDILEEVALSRAADSESEAESGHDHTTSGESDEGAIPMVFMTYWVADRIAHANHVDPRLQFAEFGAGHSHGAPLIVPVTDLGLSAEIITVASESTRTVTLVPWIVGPEGSIDMRSPPAGLKAVWTVQPVGAAPGEGATVIANGAPLKLEGLYHVTLSVTSENGPIARAHTDVCTSRAASRAFV